MLTGLRERGAEDIQVFGGGIIPEEDVVALEEIGVARVFGPGTPTRDIVDWVTSTVATSEPASKAP